MVAVAQKILEYYSLFYIIQVQWIKKWEAVGSIGLHRYFSCIIQEDNIIRTVYERQESKSWVEISKALRR